MRFISKIMVLTALMAVASACGPGGRAPWEHSSDAGDSEPDAPTPPDNGQQGTPGGQVTAGSSGQQHSDLPPVETYLVAGTIIPPRLMAPTLTVSFRSNLPQATFECLRDVERDWLDCGGSTYNFGRLVHSRSYALKVRAKTPDGRVDDSPVAIDFVADLITGLPPQTPSTPTSAHIARIPQSVADLPQPAPGGATGISGRLLQVGDYYGVNVPLPAQVTSYATNKTFNSAVHAMWLLNSPLTTVFAGQGCALDFERSVTAPGGADYCDALPADAQWQGMTPTMPQNHLELVQTSSSGALSEKLLVAAFDSHPDPSEAHFGLGATCTGAYFTGQSAVPVLLDFYSRPARSVTMQWCEVRDQTGQWWWIGGFAAPLSADPGAPRLDVIYTANAQLGIFSGPQFASLATTRLTQMLVPLAPVGISP